VLTPSKSPVQVNSEIFYPVRLRKVGIVYFDRWARVLVESEGDLYSFSRRTAMFEFC
jgi:hypothetical protein